MKHFFVFLSIILSAQVLFAADDNLSLNELLDDIDKSLAVRDKYRNSRQAKINELKDRIPTTPTDSLGKLYSQIASMQIWRFDTARVYYRKAHDFFESRGDHGRAAVMTAQLAVLQTAVGNIPEGIKTFEDAESQLSTAETKERYYLNGLLLYERLLPIYADDIAMKETYLNRRYRMADSLEVYAPAHTGALHLAKATKYERDKEYSLMLAELNEAFSTNTREKEEIYNPVAMRLGDYYRLINKPEEAAYYYGLAARNSLKKGTYFARPLQSLGLVLNSLGDDDRSINYMTESFNEAVSSNNRLRAMQLMNTFPLINEAFRAHHAEDIRLIWILSIILGIAIIAIGYMAWRQVQLGKRLKHKDFELRSNNENKISNISQFLTFCSNYLEQLHTFNRTARRRIKAGQLEDLYSMINSNQLVDVQTREFLQSFDRSFLHVFPSFVDNVNKLVNPDQLFIQPVKSQLSTELRILAFIRLGIKDSNRIAHFMGLSINTVYTYRNKMKSRANDRDNFETNIEMIDIE